MKKTMILILAGALLLAAAGCVNGGNRIQTFGNSDKGLYLYRDISLEDVLIADFDTSKYDLNEYRGFLDEEIAAYNDTHDFVPVLPSARDESAVAMTAPVTVTKCMVTGGKLRQQLLYANAGDFVEYNTEEILKSERKGAKLNAGTLEHVDGAVLAAKILKPDGEELEVNKICLSNDAGKYRFIVTDMDVVLYGDGQIVGYSSGARYDKENNCVIVPGGSVEAVIFK
ncbi:MAG: hypothetical protein IK088_00420 [Lachnospiraceae bacterium]|nr:hypothetical protein [Lachnospiraceae bacterium]